MENAPWTVLPDLKPLTLWAVIDIFFDVTIASLPGVFS